MSASRFSNVAFVCGTFPAAQEAHAELTRRYPHVSPVEADVIVALGGDGFMLRAIHEHMSRGVPIYGMNLGTVGFLMNRYHPDGLIERLQNAQAQRLIPLRLLAHGTDGSVYEALAINEVTLFRETAQAAHIRITVDGRERLEMLVCDGVLVATPAGSTAYNMSAYGPILPINSDLLALTAISAYRPRRWRGALLHHEATVTFEILNAERRKVGATADFSEFRDVEKATVRVDRTLGPTLLFDPEHALDERIIAEQFMI
ncbi:MAG: NAD kinase [Magnetospiraceae bacterium]